MRVAFYVRMKGNYTNLMRQNGIKSRPPWFTNRPLPRPKPIRLRPSSMKNLHIPPEAIGNPVASTPVNNILSEIAGMMWKMSPEAQEQLVRGFSGQLPSSSAAVLAHNPHQMFTHHHLPPMAIDLTRPIANSSDKPMPLPSPHFGFPSRNKSGKPLPNKRPYFSNQHPPPFPPHNNGFPPPPLPLSSDSSLEAKRRRAVDVFAAAQHPVAAEWRFAHGRTIVPPPPQLPPPNAMLRYPFNSL